MRYLFLVLFSILSNVVWSQCVGTEGQVTWSYWQEVNRFYRFDEFKYKDRFPKGPDGFRKINSLQSPYNFDEFMAGQIKGFLSVPEDAEVIFNVTGDDSLQLFLSTDPSAANLTLIAASNAGEEEEHDLYSTQTSEPITLQAGQDYYFEVLYNEMGWRDFAYVYWKTTFLDGLGSDVNWQAITFDYLKDVCETPCSNRGTPCDDGNANTTNDQQDGNCNCIGDPITTNECVGQRGEIQQYVYENIPSWEIENLYNDPDYPDAPDAIRPFDGDMIETTSFADGDVVDYGIRIQAYLTVPVTGNYSFNIAGSVENRFYISSDDTEANKEANILRITGWTDFYGHESEDTWNDTQQTLSNIFLETGKYYYIELVHKGHVQWNFYSIFWNGPQHPDDNWRRLPNFYLFDHTCNEPCLKAGVACNDTNPYTANDQWDGNCNCAGTPCTGPDDCDDPAALYPKYEDCGTTEQLDNRADDAWLSCAPVSASPNSDREESHWIQYNLGSPYTLDNIHIWNYNVANATNLGFQNVVIDYSLDGTNWEELGTYTWNQATGASGYEGFDLPNIVDFTAQYILFTSLDPTSSCRGLSKVTFSAYSCPTITFANLTDGQTFENPATIDVTIEVNSTVSSVALYIGDHLISTDNTAPYSWNSVAQLSNLPIGDYSLTAVSTDEVGGKCSASASFQVLNSSEECQEEVLTLPVVNLPIYKTRQTISSTAVISSSTTFEAEQSIELFPGFEVTNGATFIASIEECTPNTLVEKASSRARIAHITANAKALSSSVQIFPNPVQNDFSITVSTEQEGVLNIEVFNVAGQRIPNLSYQKSIGSGQYQIPFTASQLADGLYFCKIKVGENIHTASFVKGSL